MMHRLKTTNIRSFCQRVSGSLILRSRDCLDLTFRDHQTAFKSKTTSEVIRALAVYNICSLNFIVDNNKKIMDIFKKVFGQRIFSIAMKKTFYGHFVAGEDEKQIQPILSRLSSFGVHSILDYSVEEDVSQEEGLIRDITALIPESGVPDNVLPKYNPHGMCHDRRYKVRSARTYFYMNEATCEKNMETFIKCLETMPNDSQGLIAIKMTALGRPQLLLQISEVIVRARKFINQLVGGDGSVLEHHITKKTVLEKLNESGVPTEKSETFLQKSISDESELIHLFPWSGIIDSNLELNEAFLVPDMDTGNLVRLISQLSQKEEEAFRNMIRRVSNVIQMASNMGVSVMVDAEQSYLQPAISRLVMELMRKFNKKRPVVLNTYQCYLKEAHQELSTDLQQASRQNFYFGAKLVRGAYLEQERDRAVTLNYPDPTNASFEETTEMYNKCLMECLKGAQKFKEREEDPRRVTFMVASHNEDTVKFAIEKMLEAGVEDEGVVSFGQLYGMCDYLTFPLGQSGFPVYKYVPYGPVNEVIPYLSRRAHENKGIFEKVKKEKSLLWKELLRRCVTLQVFRKPIGYYNPA